MRTQIMREAMPDRRRSWTQKVHIGGQTCYLTVGLYSDGRPGEIFVDVAKAGTFVRGVVSTCARAISIALQCGADLDTVIHMLRGHDYPPHGTVEGSDSVSHCVSVMDWVASELEARYLHPHLEQVRPLQGEGDVGRQCSSTSHTPTLPPPPVHGEKAAGRISESWRSGA